MFLDFLQDARSQGFRVIIDGVFNHVGRAHPFWHDVLINGKNSPYADWFEITDWGDEKNWVASKDPYQIHGKPGGIQWRAWDQENGYLPVFKKSPQTGLTDGPYQHIMAVTTRWLDPDQNPQTLDGIDGWRLDVPQDIPHPFWIEWRKTVKAANPDAYITGEIWSPAQPWINAGDQFDAVMNYQFAILMQQYFANQKDAITPRQFNDRLVRLVYMYPIQAGLVMQNLLDSHDTDRAASWLINPDRPYDGQNRPQDNARDNPYSDRAPTKLEWARFKQMVAFKNLFIGAPMTYYGDEFGMWSSDDPSNRQPLPWEDKGPYTQDGVGFNKDVFETFQRYIAIRNAIPALRRGFYAPLKIDDSAGIIAFERTLPPVGEVAGARVVVVLNRSHKPAEVNIHGTFRGSFINYADPAQVQIVIPEKSRPVPIVVENATAIQAAADFSLTVKVDAWGVAVLVPSN